MWIVPCQPVETVQLKLSRVFLWCRLNPGAEAFVEAGAFVTPVPDHKTNTAGRDIFSWPSEEISWRDTKRIKDSRQNDGNFVKTRNKRQNYRRLNFCMACRGQKWVTVVIISRFRLGRPFHFAFSLWYLTAVLFRFNGSNALTASGNSVFMKKTVWPLIWSNLDHLAK